MESVESILGNDRSARGLSAAETRPEEIAKAPGERLLKSGEAEREDEEKGRFHVRAMATAQGEAKRQGDYRFSRKNSTGIA